MKLADLNKVDSFHVKHHDGGSIVTVSGCTEDLVWFTVVRICSSLEELQTYLIEVLNKEAFLGV